MSLTKEWFENKSPVMFSNYINFLMTGEAGGGDDQPVTAMGQVVCRILGQG